MHGQSTDIPLVIIRYDNTKSPARITATVKYRTDGAKVDNAPEKFLTFGAVGVDTDINYQIKVINGVAVVTVNGLTQSQNFYATDQNWTNVNFYFKAGAYYVGNGGTTNPAQVSFYELTMKHVAN